MEDIDFIIKESNQSESFFKKEISSLEKNGAILLGGIQILEEYLQYKKEHFKVNSYDINEMKEMIIKFLRILALIDVYQYYDSKNETKLNESFFLMDDNAYSIRMNKFLNELAEDQKWIVLM